MAGWQVLIIVVVLALAAGIVVMVVTHAVSAVQRRNRWPW